MSRSAFFGARRAVAAVEFAIFLPALLALLAGLVDLSLYFLTARRLSTAAEQTALVASTMAVQSAALNRISGQQAWQATTAPYALFPAWRTGSGYAITLSAVAFQHDCTAGCPYAGAVAWSVANPAGQIRLRPCGSVPAVPDGSAPTLAALPAGVFGATSVLVADVSTQWVPPLAGVFVGPVTLLRSAYVSPRIGNGVALTSRGPGATVLCPGA